MAIPNTFLSEAALINELHIKSRIGAEALYDRYSKSIYGVLIKMVKNEEMAEDLLQQAIVKIWSSIESYNAEKGRLFIWMIAVTRNLARDYLRSKSYQQLLATAPLDIYVNIIAKRDYVVFNSNTIGVKALVGNLKKDHKDVLNLIYFKGYTHTEVAEELRMPLGTVKSHCHKAICKLREIFNERPAYSET